jgi:deoxyribose-phosphate aldolase
MRSAACCNSICLPKLENGICILEINQVIEHTVLGAGATSHDIEAACQAARKYQFRALVVNPIWIPLAKKLLNGSPVIVVTVIGFPLGAVTTDIKVAEIIRAIHLGASEFDVVMSIGKARDGDWASVANEICLVQQGARDLNLKVIIEGSLLTPAQVAEACRMLGQAGVWAVKTGTGMGPRGVTVDDVRLLKQLVGDSLRIKAAGGIRSYAFAKELIDAGADLIGTSSGPAIMEEA